jgi:hypothetical protein
VHNLDTRQLALIGLTAFVKNQVKIQLNVEDTLLSLFPLRYSPNWALASSILRLRASLSSAELLQFLHFNILLASQSIFLWAFPVLCILSVPFRPSSSTRDSRTGVSPVKCSWLAPFSCLNHRCRCYTSNTVLSVFIL